MGRPIGTFGDPVIRARAWDWLAAVQTCAGVDKARHLERHPSLGRALPANRLHFDPIRQDGYDPARIEVGPGKSLLAFVAQKRRYKSACDDYHHPFWLHLMSRSQNWPEQERWLSSQLKLHALVRVSVNNHSHGVELGLLPDEDPDFSAPPEINLRPERFATLNGMLLLLLLLREAQDATYTSSAARFIACLRSAATEYSLIRGYSGENLDTWKVLVESRMATWRPHINPTLDQLKVAEGSINYEMRRLKRQGRKPVAPSSLAPGSRSERRLRRRVWIRACCLHLADDRRPSFDYRDASLVYQWLDENETSISLHMTRAIELLVTGEVEKEPLNLLPLTMPEELYTLRKRKIPSEQERHVFGNELPFDVIPIEPHK
ncbi:MAG: hypothetical protein JSR63_05760 [Proteobacteria bacterium]|nr:hypothetical protein [Pseudomonadota bacterium]